MMTHHSRESKSSKTRWSFLSRSDNSTVTNGPSQRGFVSPDMGRSMPQSSQPLSSISPRSSQSINSAIANIGLSAPTSFRFSPTLEGGSSKPKFLSFISNQKNLSESTIRGAAGSQVRNDPNSLGEKSVFVMDLEPIWNDIEGDDELERLGAESNIENQRCSNLLNPNTVMEEYVCPLLNASLPLAKPLGKNEKSESNQRLQDNPLNISGISSESLSLEERLRRERQRVHSNGVTQFDWGLNMTPLTRTFPSTVSTCTSMDLIKYQQSTEGNTDLRIIVPLRGNIYIQDGVGDKVESPLCLLYDKSTLKKKKTQHETKTEKDTGKCASVGCSIGQDTGAIDPQLSPDGSMVAFVVKGDIYVMPCNDYTSNDNDINETDDISHMKKSNISDSSSFSYNPNRCPTQITFGAMLEEDNESEDDSKITDKVSKDCDQGTQAIKIYGRCVTHGLADFVAQEEMDRYQGFWWNDDSTGLIFARVDESCVPPYRISHHGSGESSGEHDNYEEHRYPFAGGANPVVCLGYVDINREVILGSASEFDCDSAAKQNWKESKWFYPPDEASEYLARLNWLPDGSACAQWQDRRQKVVLLVRHDVKRGDSIILHREESNIWINLHHMFKVLPKPVHPNECLDDKTLAEDFELPEHSFSYVFVSERTGYSHLYLYTYIPGDVSATLLRAVSAGEWIVESIAGIDTRNDLIYFTGTFDSPLEKHLYALPLKSSSGWNSTLPVNENEDVGKVRRSIRQVMNSLSGATTDCKERLTASTSYTYPLPVNSTIPPDPIRLTFETGMHSIVMDSSCRIFLDSCSDLTRPPTVKIYSISPCGATCEGKGSFAANLRLRCVLFDATKDYVPSMCPSAPEILSFPTSDGTATLHASLYLPNPKVHGNGPYPLICSVYGGPHVQRVNRSWSQCTDMRVQRLCSMGFAVVKCDNRGSSRRGLEFEGAIKHHLGKLEVLDQVAAVRHLAIKRIIDPLRVGIYGWSYGGYLAAMCLCRAPDIFKVGIAGAPVTSWDGYDTHYTERYMGLPSENQAGYQESAVLEHVSNMRGKLLIIHGLIDENVHFRHTARLINRMVETGKDYDLLLFPDERHSPRKLRERMYMEKRMFDYFIKNLSNAPRQSILGNL